MGAAYITYSYNLMIAGHWSPAQALRVLEVLSHDIPGRSKKENSLYSTCQILQLLASGQVSWGGRLS